MTASKVCPVVLRHIGPTVDVLAFEHPLAGYQLVKGTVEAGEALEMAALRELAEESGITSANVVRSLGTSLAISEGQVWAFFQCQPTQALPETWLHHALDDGGHTFRFFWHALSAEANPINWHLSFRNALSFIRKSIG